MAATIASMTSGRRASEKLGTHSTSERGVDMATTSGGRRVQTRMGPRQKNAVAPLDGADDYTKGQRESEMTGLVLQGNRVLIPLSPNSPVAAGFIPAEPARA